MLVWKAKSGGFESWCNEHFSLNLLDIKFNIRSKYLVFALVEYIDNRSSTESGLSKLKAEAEYNEWSGLW